MEVQEALRLLQLQGADGEPLTAEGLRKQYLRLALRTHPDKNPEDPLAAERFQALGAAHALLLERLHHDAGLLAEQQRTAALLALLVRAMQGEDVDRELRAMGEYRPPAAFGVDLAVAFDGRVPRAGGSSDCGEGQQPDLRQAFANAFQEEGLTEEGDPAEGYEVPLDRECC
jgi:hypothetical protein